MQLKYGCNPHQPFASVEALEEGRLPVVVRNGTPSMINYLDALNACQLVREVRTALDLPAAASLIFAFQPLAKSKAEVKACSAPSEKSHGTRIVPICIAPPYVVPRRPLQKECHHRRCVHQI